MPPQSPKRASSPRRPSSPGRSPGRGVTPYHVALATIERSVSNCPPTDLGTNDRGREFLQHNGTQPGVITLPSGLQYKRLKGGSKAGAVSPKLDTPCVCHYSGTLLDGTEFDSSRRRGAPASFTPSSVVQGWTIALQLMGVGDHWQLTIPSELAYGDAGRADEARGEYIAPGEVLIFELELLSVKGPSKPKPMRPPDFSIKAQERERAAKVRQRALAWHRH